MAKKEQTKKKELPRTYKITDNVVCIDYEGLSKEVEDWLLKKDVHTIKKVFGVGDNCVLILEEIEGTYPLLNKDPYPFMSDRFIKSK